MQYYLHSQCGNLGIYQNLDNEKFIIKDEKIVEIEIIPLVGAKAVCSKKIKNIERVSEYLALVTFSNRISGYIWIKGKHSLYPEPQPNLYVNKFIGDHQQTYHFPMHS